MNPIEKYIVKVNNMSNQEKIIELGTLVYNLYNIQSFAKQQFIRYCIRIIIRKLSKHRKFFINQANYWFIY